MPEFKTGNTGLLYRPPQARDFRLGAITKAPREILVQDGDWRPFVSEHEVQRSDYFDSMSCVSFAAANALEAIFRRKWDAIQNFSDRALAKMSGTTKQGNYLTTVADTIRNKGLLREEEWPWMKEGLKSWEEYMSELPETLLKRALDFVALYDVMYEWVYPDWGEDRYPEALKMSPIQVGMNYAYESHKDQFGVYHPSGHIAGHSTLLLHIDSEGYQYIQDHYNAPIKKLSPDYPLPYGLRFYAGKKTPNVPTPPMYNFQENHAYFVEKSKGFVLCFFAGKLRYDDATKLRWQMDFRNDGNIEGKLHVITPAELKNVPVYDLKGRPVDITHLF